MKCTPGRFKSPRADYLKPQYIVNCSTDTQGMIILTAFPMTCRPMGSPRCVLVPCRNRERRTGGKEIEDSGQVHSMIPAIVVELRKIQLGLADLGRCHGHYRTQEPVKPGKNFRQPAPRFCADDFYSLVINRPNLPSFLDERDHIGVHAIPPLFEVPTEISRHEYFPVVVPHFLQIRRPVQLHSRYPGPCICTFSWHKIWRFLHLTNGHMPEVHGKCKVESRQVIGHWRLKTLRRDNGLNVAVVGSLGDRHEQGNIIDGSCQRTEIERCIEHAGKNIHGDAAHTGLEPKDTAKRGWNAHGAAHIAAFRQRYTAVATRTEPPDAAGCMFRVPGVSGSARQGAVGESVVGKLGCCRFAHDNGNRCF